ncbi:PAS domain-containing sensor histidine kinase [Chthonobacter rhizosphaerae]|uniref:PAS domain-containing sensor histidine kinase n=1 Tax=Chthonobacter rhizosphaerae TaxID=2735553 RepID=UPI0015EEA09B|nr:PAS domain-containing sensor histidine kinase [Chthonobacter rhizosphaerae]
MPDFGRKRRRIRSAARRPRWLIGSFAAASRPVAPSLLGATVLATPAFAQAVRFQNDGVQFDTIQVAWFSALVGAICFAVVSAGALIRARGRAEKDRADLIVQTADLKLAADRAEAVLNADDQRVVIFPTGSEAPIVMGSLPEGAGAPKGKMAFLAFGQWLDAPSSQRLAERLDALRNRGEPFSDILRTASGTHLEATGRVAGSRAFARFRNLTRERLQYVELAERHERQRREVDTLHSLLEALPMPVWTRDRDGRITWVNKAYARAVEVANTTVAVDAGHELLDTAGRQAVAASRADTDVFRQRLSVVTAGTRRVFDVVDAVSPEGSAGIATDVSDLERAQVELKRTHDSNASTLDQLATAVAIFGADRRLQFYNAAYRSLFGLDTKFLESKPEDGAILDQLRALRKLPEQADYRSWRRDMLASYQAMEPRETWWHLPGGQTLRVVANPHPQGGVTYVYENVTERLELESRYNALIRVQGETLDHLSEGVAVFGSDGRLRLWNPAFAGLWRLDDAALTGRPHVNDVVGRCRILHDDDEVWERIRMAIAGLADTRTRLSGRLERRDGGVIDFTTVPLPDGATLVTFVNVTDTVNVERALVDKNEALEAADQLKNTFIQHVSYELRSPLTNIIGFAQLLGDENAGPLNPKQREYTGYILGSSSALLAIINDILDLATVDAGVMELDLADVDIAATVDAAAAGLRDRLTEARINLKLDVPASIGHFVADEKRIRQILYNLLSNAVAFSDDGGVVEVVCRREGRSILFTVRDHGRGIPEDYLDAVFARFESRPVGARRRGAGLGLSIVKSFVELHGGTVEIVSNEGQGTTVTCRLPDTPGVTRTSGVEELAAPSMPAE